MGTRRLVDLFWPAAALACALAAWLFLPRAVQEPPSAPRLRVALVDVSASVSRARGWLPWVRAELRALAEEAGAQGDELAVLACADGVGTGFGPGDPARFLARLSGREGAPFDPGLGLARGATRLAEALEAAEALLASPRRPAGELVLYAPLTYTGANPAGVLARLAAAGVRLVERAPPRAEASDLGVAELLLPPRVEAGAPLVAVARLLWRRGTEASVGATLSLEIECDGSVRTVTRTLALPGLDGAFELPIDCGPAGFGRTVISARCRLEPGPDLFPENDRARASCTAEGARVLGVAVEPGLRAAAEAWLAPAGRSALSGLQFVFLEPATLASELAGLDALVSFDLALAELPAELVSSFVGRGGGWLVTSGFGFLDDWIPGEAGGALHALLPAEPAQEDAPPRDVLLLVDGSGSMEGQPFETVRAAALELVSAALPSDRVSLRFFTVRLEREHVLKERSASRRADQDAARRAADELLALRVPSGTTFLLHSLQQVAAGAGEHETLALLLTDGWEREGLPDAVALAGTIRADLARTRTKLVVIAVGEPNLPLLGTLAGGNERVRSGSTLEELRAVFHRELYGARVAEGELAVGLAARAPGSLAHELVSAGVEVSLPPLERYVRNRLRPGAETLWESSEGEPLLALGRAGLGRVALFASQPGPGWGSGYARTGLGEPAEFERLLRWLARGPERGEGGEAEPMARFEDGWLRVTGLAPDTPAELVAELVAVLEDGVEREPERRIELRMWPPSGPGRAPLRTREVRWEGSLDDSAVLLLASGATGAPALALAIARSLAEEFTWREGVTALPELPGTGSALPQAGVGAASHRAAPWMLALALALLLAAGLASARSPRGGSRSRSRISGLRSIEAARERIAHPGDPSP